MRIFTTTVALLLVIFFSNCADKRQEKEMLPGWDMLDNPTSDTLVGKTFNDKRLNGEACLYVHVARGWDKVEALIKDIVKGAVEAKLKQGIDAKFEFSKNKIQTRSIEEVSFQTVDDYSVLKLDSKGNVVVAAAIAVNAFTVDVQDEVKFETQVRSIRKDIPDLQVVVDNDKRILKTGKGLTVAVQCIQIDSFAVFYQTVPWKKNNAEFIDTVFGVKEFLSLSEELVPKAFMLNRLKIEMGGKFSNKVWGDSLIFSPSPSQVDAKASGIRDVFETDPSCYLNIPKVISGGTDAKKIVRYELKVDSAKVTYRKVHRFKTSNKPTYSVFGGQLDDSEGEFTVVTKLWVFSVPNR